MCEGLLQVTTPSSISCYCAETKHCYMHFSGNDVMLGTIASSHGKVARYELVTGTCTIEIISFVTHKASVRCCFDEQTFIARSLQSANSRGKEMHHHNDVMEENLLKLRKRIHRYKMAYCVS